MQDLQAQLDELRENAAVFEVDSENAQTQLNECFERISELSTLDGDLRGKRIQLQTKKENIEKLERNITQMSESDLQLQQMLETYEESVEVLQNNDKQFRKRYTEAQSQMQSTRSILSTKEREIGSLDALKTNWERQVDERRQLVKQIARDHSLRGFELDVDEQRISVFKEKMNKVKRDQVTNLEKAREQSNAEMQKAQTALTTLGAKKSEYLQRKDAARSAINLNDKKIETFQIEHDRLDIDEGTRATLESSISDIQANLDSAKTKFVTAEWDKKLEKVESEMNELDANREDLDAELVEGTKSASETAQLDHLQKELKEAKTGLDGMTKSHSDRIREVLGNEWSSETLDADFQKALQTSSKKASDAEKQRDGKSNELEQLNFRLKTCKSELKRRLEEVKKIETAMGEVLEDGPADFPGRLSELEEQGDVVSNNTSASERMAQYFKDSAETAKKHSVCRLCRRAFEKDSKNLQTFLASLQKDIEKLEKQKAADEAEELLSELRTMRAFVPSYETWKRLTEADIPALEENERRLTAESEALTQEVESFDQTVVDRQGEKRELEGLSKTVQSMLKYQNDIQNYAKQIDGLKAAQKDNPKQGRGMEEIKDHIKALSEKARNAKTNYTRLTSEREKARATINNLELALRDSRSKFESASFQLKEKTNLQRQVTDLKATNTDHRAAVAAADTGIKDLGPELGQAQANYDEIMKQGSEKDAQMREEISKIENNLNRLALVEKQINAYQDGDSPAQLHRVKQNIESLKSDIQNSEQEILQITKEVKNIENQIRNNADTKRSISDNLDYRRDKRDVESVSAEIEELESRNVETEKTQWENKRRQWENERLRLSAAQNKIVGQLSEKDDRLLHGVQTWKTDYKDAKLKYKESHINVETTKAAIEDLGRYAGALDNAIMKYHALKMESINRIIDELWRRTYQGTDVDTIMIRSENENQKNGKSYKYRVCMMKADAEMDMRGRCSAGQKVLASIIIRLALAECFGVNCGLIALDEPTTNLDRDNIQALAKALSDIIRVRRQQSNFQLIVITHDEEFLRYMQCSDFADEYYRVDRNGQQDSQIYKQSISQVSRKIYMLSSLLHIDMFVT